MYIECEYVTKVEGKTLSVFYDGGYRWTAWLEGKGNIAWDFNAEDTIKEAQEKLGIDNLEFKYVEH